jgi:hypothetical protein
MFAKHNIDYTCYKLSLLGQRAAHKEASRAGKWLRRLMAVPAEMENIRGGSPSTVGKQHQGRVVGSEIPTAGYLSD